MSKLHGKNIEPASISEQMKLINQAWDVLSGEHGAVSHAVTSADRKAQRAEWEKKEKEMSVRVVRTLETTITPQALIQHTDEASCRN